MKNGKEVMRQMKKGLYNQSEERKIRLPDQSAQEQGTGKTLSELQNRKS